MPDIFSDKALAAVTRYSRLLDQFRNQFDAAIRSDPSRGDTKRVAHGQCVEYSKKYLERENEIIGADTAEVAQNALRDVYSEITNDPRDLKLPDELVTHITMTGELLGRALAAQVERDVVTLMKEVSVAGLNVALNVEAGDTKDIAILKVLADKPRIQAFRFIDRIGRKYNSTKHVRDQYRLHLLTTYNEVYLHTLASFGYDEAEIWTPDVRSEAYGQKISITSGGSYPSYYEVQDKWFHPTSQALVRLSVES